MFNKIFLWLMACSFFIATTPVSAGLFGPSNFDECVLDGVKDAKTETAARLVAQACRNKFPLPTTPAYNEPVTNNYGFSGLSAYRPAVYDFVSKIEIVRSKVAHHGQDYGYGIKDNWFRYYIDVTVTNRNTFPITGIIIGINKRKSKTCSWDSNDYAEFYDCPGLAGVQQTASFECNVKDANKRQVNYCLVGFYVNGTESSIKQFMKNNNIPPLGKN